MVLINDDYEKDGLDDSTIIMVISLSHWHHIVRHGAETGANCIVSNHCTFSFASDSSNAAP